MFASTVGLRDQFQLPTSTLERRHRVNNGTTTYNFGLSQNVNVVWRRLHRVNWTQPARRDVDHAFATCNPAYTTNLVAAYAQPLMRGFKIDNMRQQLLINLINRDISEESARATVTQTLANVRNAYWDLVFAQSAVEVAQRARTWPTSWSSTTRRASKSARSRRSTSCRRRPKPRRAGRTSRRPKRPRRPPSSRSSASW